MAPTSVFLPEYWIPKENPQRQRSLGAAVHGVPKSWTRLSNKALLVQLAKQCCAVIGLWYFLQKWCIKTHRHTNNVTVQYFEKHSNIVQNVAYRGWIGWTGKENYWLKRQRGWETVELKDSQQWEMRWWGQAAASLPLDSDGRADEDGRADADSRADADGRAEGCSLMGGVGKLQCYWCLMLMAQVLLPSWTQFYPLSSKTELVMSG